MSSSILSPTQFPEDIRAHAKRETRQGHMRWAVKTKGTSLAGKRVVAGWLKDHGFTYIGGTWALYDIVALGGKIGEPESFKPEVIADHSGLFCTNGQQFATEKEALDAGNELASRWFLVTAVRVVGSRDPINYEFIEGRARPMQAEAV